MHPTTRVLAKHGFPSFWKRSLDEFKRLSNIAIKLEGVYGTQKSLTLWDFSDPNSVESCVDMSDHDIGGFSSAGLSYVPASGTSSGHAKFSGNISNKLPKNAAEVERTGYAAFRTRDRPGTLFGRSLWDVELYTWLAMRVKSDGRKYKINVQTESLEFTDLHQHRLYAKRPGDWETVLVPWKDFVRTNHGLVVEPQSEMMLDKVRTIGIGLTDRLAGPFEFRIAKIWATNHITEEEMAAAERPEPVYVPRSTKAQNIEKQTSRDT